jgi:hypothetical protein
VTIRSAVISGAVRLGRVHRDHHAGQQRLRGRRYALTAIDAGHWLLVVIVMGVVIGWIGV